MQDKIDALFNEADKNIDKFNACVESYIERVGKLSPQTIISILRTFETAIIKAAKVEESRMIHNNLRQYILDKSVQ